MSKLLIFLLLSISLAQGSRICNQCKGIQCSNTSHNETKICDDSLDVCVSIFEDFTVVERGCSEEISSNLMKKCSEPNNNIGNTENSICLKCSENLCNNEGRKLYECIPCDPNVNPDCQNNPCNKNAIKTSEGSPILRYVNEEESTDTPAIDEPATDKPETDETSTAQPTTAQPTEPTAQPTTAEPTTAQPTTAQPTTAQPTTAQPTTAQPTTAQPTEPTAIPTTAEPTTAQPTTPQPTTPQPTTPQPTTDAPTTGTTAKPTAKPGSANAINFSMSILILSIIFNFIN